MRKQNLKLLTLLSISAFLCGCGGTPASSSLSSETPESSSEIITSSRKTSTSIDYSVSTHETGTYSNSLFLNGADPGIFRDPVSGKFYCYTTEESADWRLDGVKFTAYGPILESEDLVNWTYVGSVFAHKEDVPDWMEDPSGEPIYDRHIWAPSVLYRNNLYYYYYSLANMQSINNGIGVCTSETPVGPWTDHGKLIDTLSCGNTCCIDPCVVEENGELYMTYGSFNEIDIIKLSSDGLSVELDEYGEPAYTKIANRAYEGSCIIKMFGSWYLFGSAGSTTKGADSTYYVNVYRSDNIMGPYKDSFGTYALTGGGNLVISPTLSLKPSKAAGTGGNTVIEDDDGAFWIVYHATNKEKVGKRELCIDRLLFDKDGFPYVEDYCSTMGYGPTKAPYVR